MGCSIRPRPNGWARGRFLESVEARAWYRLSSPAMARNSTALLLPVLFSFGCGLLGQQGADGPIDDEARVREEGYPAAIIDASGRELTFDELIAELAEAQAIYLGERHDQVADHVMQYAIVRGLQRRQTRLAVGLEMVQRPYQEHLDSWVRGRLDESVLRSRIQWERRWGFEFALYRPIFELARAERVRLRALNARSELTRAVAREGLEALDESMRAELPELDLEDDAHREMVMAALEGHTHGGEMDPAAIERLYAAQVVWDETMAQGVAELIEAGVPQIIVLAGRFHVESGLGIPRRAQRRGVRSGKIVLAVRPDELEEARSADPPLADYLWVVDEDYD